MKIKGGQKFDVAVGVLERVGERLAFFGQRKFYHAKFQVAVKDVLFGIGAAKLFNLHVFAFAVGGFQVVERNLVVIKKAVFVF